ncbi:GAF domain protein [Actinobacteria bacterium OK074]|nr:GAF domain protein [Actinobacteria bacterium OK074]
MTPDPHPYPPAAPHARELQLPRRTVPLGPPVREVIVPPPGTITLGSEPGSTLDRELDALDERLAALHRTGHGTGPSAFFDGLATRVAEATGFPYGMVNLYLADQTFTGLHNPPPESGLPQVGRTMSRRHGYCPEVVAGRKALPLWDVRASPRFAGNPVVDAIGILAYFGAPILFTDSHGTERVLGTVCVIDVEPRHKHQAAELRDTTKDAAREATTAFGLPVPRALAP